MTLLRFHRDFTSMKYNPVGRMVARIVPGHVVHRLWGAMAQVPDDEKTEQSAKGPDTDSVEEQVGDQVDEGQPDEHAAAEADSSASEADEAAALASKVSISSDQATATVLAANPGASVAKVELDDEEGAIVYSIELTNGTDVKVDANSGAIVRTETGIDQEVDD